MPPFSSERQLTLFDLPEANRVVNVASVPQRSPFRYPGGKTWLVPQIRRWLFSVKKKPNLLVEPFAGGGIVGLTAAFEDLVSHVILVELDEQIAAVWKTILEGDADWLANRIIDFDLTIDSVKDALSLKPKTIQDAAFQTILKNRTYHGGILAPGSSLIKTGENGRGVASRWYPSTLAKRIRAIGRLRDRFTFIHGDGIAVLEEHLSDPDSVFFIDPPYTAGTGKSKRAGARLYTHHSLDHKRLVSIAARLAGDVLITYEDSADIRALVKEFGFDAKTIAMKNTHHATMNELLVGRRLKWLL